MFNSRKEALAIVGSLSEPSKMPCYGYGLPASACIAGSKLHKVEGTICRTCYALRGHYMYGHVQDAHQIRLQSLSNPRWVEAMVYLIRGNSYFRWHDSGDLQSLEHLKMIADIARQTPETMHWLPTREYQMVKTFITEMKSIARVKKKALKRFVPQNLIIRLSATRFEQKGPEQLAKNLGVLVSSASKTGFTCPASTQGNKCLDCRMCWNPSVFDVSYHRH
jgi:Gene product 88